MPLLQATRDFLALVETETGYPVRLHEDPNLETFTSVRMARGNVPAHFVSYKPTRNESLDYMICYQCGFVLRLFELPPDQRFDFVVRAEGENQVVQELTKPGGKLARFGLSAPQARQMASVLFQGIMLHLRSIPVGMRVADWIRSNYPELGASQRAAALSELADAKTSLQPRIRDITPEDIYKATSAINAAYALFWAERFSMPELAAPYRSYGYDAGGRALLSVWNELPADPAFDRELIDRWAQMLSLAKWYSWQPYNAPE